MKTSLRNLKKTIARLLESSSSQDRLDDLLTTALANNDRDSYLVFLDVLEESDPVRRHSLDTEDTHAVLLWLSATCPNVVKTRMLNAGNTGFSFSTEPSFVMCAPRDRSDTNNVRVKYEGLSVEVYGDTVYCRIKGRFPKIGLPEMPDDNAEQVTHHAGGLIYVYFPGGEAENSEEWTLQPGDPRFDVYEDFAKVWSTRARQDVKIIQDLFEAPGDHKPNLAPWATDTLLESSQDKRKQLDDLLTSAISNNDRDSFLVFLDLLEEIDPTKRSLLNTTTGHSFFNTLKWLSNMCPGVIGQGVSPNVPLYKIFAGRPIIFYDVPNMLSVKFDGVKFHSTDTATEITFPKKNLLKTSLPVPADDDVNSVICVGGIINLNLSGERNAENEALELSKDDPRYSSYHNLVIRWTAAAKEENRKLRKLLEIPSREAT